MMMTFNWNNIRTYNNSQNNAFEELVCQLAREEQIENKQSFLRVAAPDGGVEAYCVLENGDEYGWQSKFFTSMGNRQWQQIDQSFKRALETHRNLVKYFICIPLDREDPRIPEQNWFMDKWNSKVDEWTQYAQDRARNIQFEYWGSFELIHRLSREKHSGRRHFWFNKEEFSDQWFSEKLQSSIDDLGTRYTPELNFELEIARAFDGIARDENFKNQFDRAYDDLLKKSFSVLNSLRDERLSKKKSELTEILKQIENQYAQTDFYEIQIIDYDKLLNKCKALQGGVADCEVFIDELIEKEKEGKEEKNKRSIGSDKFKFQKYDLWELHRSINRFQDFLTSITALLSNLPVLIFSGEAGVGKSHLLADIAQKRSERGQHSILLLGQHFITDESPWTQILTNLLRLNCNEIEFLEALNAKAQSIGSRLIIFIDAINEGRGKYFWKDHIKGFIKAFAKYQWLGLVISLRSSYENLLVREDVITSEIAVRLTHYGFANVEYEASKFFFKNYNIEQPSIPLLYPEFQNALFLKLFCEGLQKAGLTKIPEGYEGITTIIQFYLNSINAQLSESNRLDYPKDVNLVRKAVGSIVQKKVENDLKYVAYEDAFTLLEGQLQQFSSKRRFLDELILEGVLTKNLFWDGNNQQKEGVYLSYERFEDHFVTSLLLEKHLDKDSPENSFSEGQTLFNLVENEHKCYLNRGIVEAISIQLPELIGKELYEVAPYCRTFCPVIESFVESLVWRKTETITKESIDYVNKVVTRYKGTHDKFLDTLLLITSNPKHCFNADFLHNHLMGFSLPSRDAWWTIYLHNNFREQTSVKRLIDWAWSDEDKNHISDDSIRLTAKTLAWFLTSSHRFLRDSATKALITLLENRIPVLIQILKEFENVNDPYVYERLYAVAYGCSLRTSDSSNLRSLSEYVYRTIFGEEYVYPHMLLRDYARNIIEYSLHIGVGLEIDLNKIRPPYKSDWPSHIPSDDEIKKHEYDSKSEDFKDYYWSQNDIIQSMQPDHSKIHMYGDFGRYVFESAFRNWHSLDPQELSNLAVKRVFELGYDVEKHGEFDRNINRGFHLGRTGRKFERIGKKYQWIAFYETLARVSDNFTMYDESCWREDKPLQYDGPWGPYVRDIDPSILINHTGKERYEKHSKHWWFNVSCNDWELSNEDWVKEADNLPNPSGLILVRDDSGTEWFMLEIYPQWYEPVRIGQEKWDYPQKNLWYNIRSYLVTSQEFVKLIEWASKQDFMDGRMPGSRDRYEIFSREYYWSPAFKFFKKPYYCGELWQEIHARKSEECIGKAIVTAEIFLWEEEHDCSKEDTISFFKPAETIFNGMGMRFSSREGCLVNAKDELICFDPSVNKKSISCLLVRRDDFVEFLNENDMNIFWTVLGEKSIIGGSMETNKYLSRLEISGAYSINKKLEVTGQLNTKFLERL